MQTQTDDLKDTLDPLTFHVTQEKGTEAPFTGKYVNEHASGIYKCVVCGQELFSSEAKFDSGTGWPSFDEPMNLEHVNLITDDSHGMHRTEVECKKCGAHLGHVFDDGPTKTGQRFCINSCALNLEKK
jgi:peptide-methionine (R)-S-oxide reductase